MAKLTAGARNALLTSTFALPGRRFPINDASHARNALARASTNATPAERTTIRRKVSTRYPGIKMSMPTVKGLGRPSRSTLGSIYGGR